MKRFQTAVRLSIWFLTHLFPSFPTQISGRSSEVFFISQAQNEQMEKAQSSMGVEPRAVLWAYICPSTYALRGQLWCLDGMRKNSICMAIWCCAHGTIEGKIDCAIFLLRENKLFVVFVSQRQVAISNPGPPLCQNSCWKQGQEKSYKSEKGKKPSFWIPVEALANDGTQVWVKLELFLAMNL